VNPRWILICARPATTRLPATVTNTANAARLMRARGATSRAMACMSAGRYPKNGSPRISARGTVGPMDFAIPQDYADLRSSLRSFLDREVRPVEERYAQQMQEDVFTEEMREEGLALRRKSAELGFYAAHMPEEVGGMGLSSLGYTLLVE